MVDASSPIKFTGQAQCLFSMLFFLTSHERYRDKSMNVPIFCIAQLNDDVMMEKPRDKLSARNMSTPTCSDNILTLKR